MNLSKKLIASLTACAIALPASAANINTSLAADNTAVDYAFGNSNFTSVSILPDKDMAHIKGDAFPFAIPPVVITALKAAGWGAAVGAGAGAATGAISEARSNPNASASDIAEEAGESAVGGALIGAGAATGGGIPIIFRTTAVGLGLGWTSATSGRTPVVTVECIVTNDQVDFC